MCTFDFTQIVWYILFVRVAIYVQTKLDLEIGLRMFCNIMYTEKFYYQSIFHFPINGFFGS